MRIIEFILSNEGLRYKAKYFWPSASIPPQADAPPTFIKVIPIYEPIIPVFHYSNIPAGVKRTLEWSEILFRERKGGWAVVEGNWTGFNRETNPIL